ncbi:MAG TPA: hypothetical protein VM307_07865 [Egibacteraceae bacterium]|nr:hypothetical protein [Egibacteraceae bacterium]
MSSTRDPRDDRDVRDEDTVHLDRSHDDTAHHDEQRHHDQTLRDDDRVHRDDVAAGAPAAAAVVDRARGGVSLWSVLSGVLVAFGAFIVLAAIIGAVLAAVGAAAGGLRVEDAGTVGAVGIGVIVAQFLAYLWGGYTAGRMARGSGWVNGLLVPVVAVVAVALLGAILAAVTGATPATAQQEAQQLPLPLADLGQLATGLGIGLLVAMLLGGALGGHLGARWHTKLEDAEVGYR